MTKEEWVEFFEAVMVEFQLLKSFKKQKKKVNSQYILNQLIKSII